MGWIKCSERLPKNTGKYWVYMNNDGYCSQNAMTFLAKTTKREAKWTCAAKVTHWTDLLPEPPHD